MQTFLPYPSYEQTAKCLDMRRLGKQRVEGLQILNVLLGIGKGGWKNHPAVKMWRGHEYQLVRYIHDICWEWSERGYRDTVGEKVADLYLQHKIYDMSGEEPPWLYDEKFHASHRSNLLRKDPIHYGKFGWTEPPDLPYIWPGVANEDRIEVA
jgi:hypothetical protein